MFTLVFTRIDETGLLTCFPSKADRGDAKGGPDAACGRTEGAESRPGQGDSLLFPGEFTFYYNSYDGPWAKAGHFFQTVTILRFNVNKNSTHQGRRLLARRSLLQRSSGGYCALSWWPYEDEAIRAIWEAGKQT